jgi:hypothetical protein
MAGGAAKYLEIFPDNIGFLLIGWYLLSHRSVKYAGAQDGKDRF